MPVLTETAKAKVNLTLRILGRRLDGFHELESLVAFAEIGDVLKLEPGDGLDIAVSGPFAGSLGQDNLVVEAARRVLAICPSCRAGRLHLEKNLPVAAGLGGGSSDAAAALRLLLKANPEHLGHQDVAPLCPKLGADIAVCLDQRLAMMWGLGEKVSTLGALPRTPIVLVNPGVALATAEVFRALDAGRYDGPDRESPADPPPPFDTVGALAGYLESRGNDLEAAAIGLAPIVGDVKASLSAQAACLIARMSGSGATCFGIFESQANANRAAERIGRAHPEWWVAASNLA